MRRLIIYSSETGNTEKLANAVGKSLTTNFDMAHINTAPEAHDYDIIFVGYKINKGSIDEELKEYFHNVKGKKIFLFGTMGANPSSPYGVLIKKNVQNIFEQNNAIIGHFLCQGEITKELMNKWFTLLESTPNDLHAQKQIENYNNSLNHPDDNDILELRTLLIQSL